MIIVVGNVIVGDVVVDPGDRRWRRYTSVIFRVLIWNNKVRSGILIAGKHVRGLLHPQSPDTVRQLIYPFVDGDPGVVGCRSHKGLLECIAGVCEPARYLNIIIVIPADHEVGSVLALHDDTVILVHVLAGITSLDDDAHLSVPRIL